MTTEFIASAAAVRHAAASVREYLASPSARGLSAGTEGYLHGASASLCSVVEEPDEVLRLPTESAAHMVLRYVTAAAEAYDPTIAEALPTPAELLAADRTDDGWPSADDEARGRAQASEMFSAIAEAYRRESSLDWDYVDRVLGDALVLHRKARFHQLSASGSLDIDDLVDAALLPRFDRNRDTAYWAHRLELLLAELSGASTENCHRFLELVNDVKYEVLPSGGDYEALDALGDAFTELRSALHNEKQAIAAQLRSIQTRLLRGYLELAFPGIESRRTTLERLVRQGLPEAEPHPEDPF